MHENVGGVGVEDEPPDEEAPGFVDRRAEQDGPRVAERRLITEMGGDILRRGRQARDHESPNTTST